jgi:hypothetical protein
VNGLQFFNRRVALRFGNAHPRLEFSAAFFRTKIRSIHDFNMRVMGADAYERVPLFLQL